MTDYELKVAIVKIADALPGPTNVTFSTDGNTVRVFEDTGALLSKRVLSVSGSLRCILAALETYDLERQGEK